MYGQKAKFYVTTDARKIIEDSYVQVDFTLENAEGSNFNPPSFSGFDVVSGPSSSTSTSIVNGTVSRKVSFGYGLQPKGLGTKVIKPATIRVGNKTMKTQSISIEVVKGSSTSVSTDKQVFVKTEVTDTSTFVGQQIILNYKLYTTVDVRSANFNTEHDFDGFYVEELRSSRENYKKEVIDGVEYFTKPLKKISLFPQQTGTYTISPTSLNIGIAKKGSSRSIFFNSQLIQRRIKVDGATIYVNSLPPAANNFSGAVGRYRMTATTPKRSLTTDEAIVVKMQVTGNGDSKTVNAPDLDLPAGLETYDPNVIEDEVFRAANGLTHRKTFEYLIVAKEPGNYTIKPSFEYFDVDSSRYNTITKSLPRIRVVKGSNNATVIEEKPAVELAGIFESTNLRKTPAGSSYSDLPALLLLLLSFVGGLGIHLYSNHLKKSGKLDPDLIRKNKAYSVAIKRLEGSKSFMDKNQSKEFHEEMIRAIKTYITDKFSIPALHINRPELVSKMKSNNISDEVLSGFDDILRESEMAMYAPSSQSDLTKSYHTALDLIAELEK